MVASQVVTPAMWLQAARTLTRLAELGERAGRVFTLENLNTAVDHPGTPFARAADTVALVEAIGSPHLRLNLDLYHAQVGEGNLIELVERALPLIGEIQVADVPGRCEPGTGELNYPAVAAALNRLDYTGVVGLEAWASGDSEEALERFRAAFKPRPGSYWRPARSAPQPRRNEGHGEGGDDGADDASPPPGRSAPSRRHKVQPTAPQQTSYAKGKRHGGASRRDGLP